MKGGGMKITLLVGLLVLLCFVVGLPASLAQEEDPFLRESYILSQKLAGPEQMFYLVAFCRTGSLQYLPREKMHAAVSTLSSLSSNEKDLELRVVIQKEGAACLSYVDPMGAMDLLLKINFQQLDSGKWVYEDPRNNAAETIFGNFLISERSQAVDKIAEAARYLGRTGQYPYRGIATVIKSVLVSKYQANMLLRDAVDFYANESGFYDRDEEFLALLRAIKNSPIDNELTNRAVTLFVQRLEKNPIQFPGNYYARIRITSTGKVRSFTDRNEAFLFQALPDISRFNPGLASQLIQRNSKLSQATGQMEYLLGNFVSGDPTSERAIRQRLQWLQESLLDRIRNCQNCPPQTLESLANRLVDPNLRIVGFSAAIPGIARVTPSKARSIFKDQLSNLDNIDDSIGKLQARVALASAAFHIGNLEQYRVLSAEAFDRGIRLFNADHGGKRAARRQGFSELRDLVFFTAAQPGDILERRVEDLPAGWLKTYLCLYEAEGHARRKNSVKRIRAEHR
jgi:hypothetical protein